MRLWPLALALLLTSLACGNKPRELPGKGDVKPAAGPDSLELVTITSGGDKRSFFLAVPPDLGPGPHPLVITAHGGDRQGDLKGRMMAAPWFKHANEGIIFAFPNSIYQSKRPWFGPEDATPNKDVKFMADLIDEVAKRQDIDRSKVFMSGFSAGAGFTWQVQCTDAERYAGFAMVSAMMFDFVMEKCEPTVQRPTFYIHGDADTAVPITGKDGHGSAQKTWDWLEEQNACKELPKSTRTVAGSRGIVAKGRVLDCARGPEIELWVVEGGEHCWPTERMCSGFDGSGMILDYWRRTAGLSSAPAAGRPRR